MESTRKPSQAEIRSALRVLDETPGRPLDRLSVRMQWELATRVAEQLITERIATIKACAIDAHSMPRVLESCQQGPVIKCTKQQVMEAMLVFARAVRRADSPGEDRAAEDGFMRAMGLDG